MNYLSRFSIAVLLLALGLGGCTPTVDQEKRARSHYNLALAYLRQNNPSLALQELGQAETADPNSADIQSALGAAYAQKGAFDLALQHYRRAIEIKPGDPQLYSDQGSILLELKRWDEAIASFRRAAEDLTFPRADVAHTGIGYAFQMQQRYPEALAAYQKALQQAPRSARALLLQGETLATLGRHDEAVTSLRRAVEAVPVFPLAYYRLGVSLLALKQPRQAAEAFHKTVEQAPNSEAGRLAANYLKTLE